MALPVESVTADRTDLRLDIETAVEALPERARAVYVLHEIEGLEHHEIASIMGTDVATSRSQLHRARRMVRERLKGGDT
jgi:RNA polymerase sigma-70 factor (ECF subfamily)